MTKPLLVRELEVRYRPGTTSRRAKGDPITGPESAYTAIAAHIDPLATVERFAALVLDQKHRPIAWLPISSGTQDASLVHPREIFRAVLLGPVSSQGAALILSHNHPSGDPTPSRDDVALTERLIKTGALLGIPVLDHIITTADGNWCSMKRDGLGGF